MVRASQGSCGHEGHLKIRMPGEKEINGQGTMIEVGGKFRPLSEITGVCPRCKEQIDWKRRYGKYKPLVEPAKCQRCSKRAVRQAYHNLCSGCAKEHRVCAKCCCAVDRIVGRSS
ncbi:uncharacterized protein LOC129289371 [Prosopis cineraria]|uniref:uncharacterized protein LOC129289371 n=1 Tax=Prosopis cineraria TaxID=364024 RepID=UPI00240EFB43|nr:uncharacterized protein LOC129289371 [Prosopis cineraria]